MVAHDIRLAGPDFLGGGRPAVLQRPDENLVDTLLADLGSEDGRRKLATAPAGARDARGLKLFQPIHRTFHFALVEAYCDSFGRPRLDPDRVESAGLVVRRAAARQNRAAEPDPFDPDAGLGAEGWVRQDRAVRGWVPFTSRREADADPDPDRRRPASLGHPELDRRFSLLRGSGGPLAEAVSPLFVAPPEVCRAAGRTLLYGIIPVTSTEDAGRPAPGYPAAAVKAHLSGYLRPNLAPPLPRPGQVLAASAADAGGMEQYVTMLRQVHLELDAFRDGPESRALLAALNAVPVRYPDDTTGPLGEHLRAAAAVFVDRLGGSVRMPAAWPAITGEQGEAIAAAAKAALEARLGRIATGRGRFADPDAEYQVRAFVRGRRPDGCPPELAWSRPSEPFRVAQWFDRGPLPPRPIVLPDVGALLESLEPDVAFQVPPSLFDLLQANPDVLKNDPQPGSGPGIVWLCSLSLPAITFCAFLVLNIFLMLFDLVFHWMLFIKFCVPLPAF